MTGTEILEEVINPEGILLQSEGMLAGENPQDYVTLREKFPHDWFAFLDGGVAIHGRYIQVLKFLHDERRSDADIKEPMKYRD